jgi:hypothetical protein
VTDPGAAMPADRDPDPDREDEGAGAGGPATTIRDYSPLLCVLSNCQRVLILIFVFPSDIFDCLSDFLEGRLFTKDPEMNKKLGPVIQFDTYICVTLFQFEFRLQLETIIFYRCS